MDGIGNTVGNTHKGILSALLGDTSIVFLQGVSDHVSIGYDETYQEINVFTDHDHFTFDYSDNKEAIRKFRTLVDQHRGE